MAERDELIDERVLGLWGRGLSHACSTLVYMMPQEDKGLAIWQVQADWQYWRTVW